MRRRRARARSGWSWRGPLLLSVRPLRLLRRAGAQGRVGAAGHARNGRVGPGALLRPAPSEPDVPVSEHPAQASRRRSAGATPYDPLTGKGSSAPIGATYQVAVPSRMEGDRGGTTLFSTDAGARWEPIARRRTTGRRPLRSSSHRALRRSLGIWSGSLTRRGTLGSGDVLLVLDARRTARGLTSSDACKRSRAGLQNPRVR
jgi:hypothetical protein